MTGLGRTIVWATAAILLCAADASAQIFMGRDAAGTVVLSDRPLDTDVVTYAVQRSGYRATRATAAATGVSAAVPDSVSLYDELIERHAADQGVRPDLVRAVIQVESGFNARARSVKGAMGLMQLMPGTADDLGVTNPWDPSENIRGGVTYLAGLLRQFNDERLALAAYNAGPGAVVRYGHEVPPYRETQEYVRKITARTDVMAVATDRRSGRRPIYKVLEEIDGRQVMRLTDVRPLSGKYETLGR